MTYIIHTYLLYYETLNYHTYNTIIEVRKHMLLIKLVTIMTTKDYTTHI